MGANSPFVFWRLTGDTIPQLQSEQQGRRPHATVFRFLGSEAAHFSVDDELLETAILTIETRPQVRSVFVGEDSEPIPERA